MIYSYHYINPAEVGRHCAYTLLEVEAAQKEKKKGKNELKMR